MNVDPMTLISQLGFPMFVAVYFLVRLDSILVEIRDELRDLNNRLKG